MYAQYTYLPGATQANVLSDIVALLTGTVDVNQLSAACAKTVSSIVSTVPAGWTLSDNAAGVNAKALTAPLADDPTKLKALVIDLNTANYALTKLYESWNATTHVGTNMAYSSDAVTYSPGMYLSTGGTLLISASARHCLIASLDSNMSSFRAGTGVVEHTRNDPWNTVANGYPCSAYFSMQAPSIGAAQGTIFAPRIYSANIGADLTGVNAHLGVYNPMLCTGAYNTQHPSNGAYGIINIGTWAGPVYYGANAAKQQSMMLVPMGLARNIAGVSMLGGDISVASGIYLASASNGSTLDEVTVGADTYVIWTGGMVAYSSSVYPRFAVKKA